MDPLNDLIDSPNINPLDHPIASVYKTKESECMHTSNTLLICLKDNKSTIKVPGFSTSTDIISTKPMQFFLCNGRDGTFSRLTATIGKSESEATVLYKYKKC